MPRFRLRSSIRLSCILLWLIATALTASAQRTTNRGMHAPPSLGPVVVDGKLDEWDLSGTITCSKDIKTLLEVESARVAAMWDTKGLYLSFRFRDSTPMQNAIDPVTMPGNGWRSDSVQMRLNIAGFISHVDAWYYTDEQTPGMTISYGTMRKNVEKVPVDRPLYPTELGAKQAFRMSEDKGGYVQELFLPWAVISADGKPPAAGADMRLGLELHWGGVQGAGGMTARLTDNLSPAAKTADFFWTSEQNWGPIILETNNNLLLLPAPWERSTAAAPEPVVPLTFTLDRDSYVTLAIEDADGNRVRSLFGGKRFNKGTHTVTWSGLDDRHELLPAAEYRWTGIARDAIDLRWKMSFYQPNETTPWNIADGTGAWGSDHGCMVATAYGDGLVFMAGLGAEAGNGLIAMNTDGKKVWTVQNAGADRLAYADGILYAYRSLKSWNPLGLATTGIMRFNAKTGKWLDIKSPSGKPVKRLSLVEPDPGTKMKTVNLPGKTAGTEVIVGFAASTAGIFASVPGKDAVRWFDPTTFELKQEFALPGAGALFAPDATSLLIVTPTGITRLTLATGRLEQIIQADLTDVSAITAQKDRIWVALSEPRSQVLVFSTKGEVIRTIGQAGGVPRQGPYDPTVGFFNPSGLAVDDAGRLWVNEANMRPKRASIWKDGTWQRDFIGDTYYGGGGLINPLDPTIAFYNNMRFKIDIDTGSWQLMSLGMARPTNEAEFGITVEEDRKDAIRTEYMNAYKGRAYVYKCRRVREIYRQREDKEWVLCVYINPKEKLAWMDANDDSLIQPEEIVQGSETDDWGGTDYWGNYPSQNLDLYFEGGEKNSRVDGPGLRLPLQRVTKGGTPIYDFTAFETMAGETQNGIGLRDGSYNSGCAGERGDYFSEMRRIFRQPDQARTFWYRGENTGRWTPRQAEPGVVLYPFQPHGIVDLPSIQGELICWVSDFGQRYLFTSDMLYVDQLFADGRSQFEPWPANPKTGFKANTMAPGQESFHGFFTRTTGGRYLLTSGFTDCRVFELFGIDSIRRLSGGPILLEQRHLARAQEIRDYRLSGGKVQSSIAIGATPSEPVTISFDDKRSAEVTMRADTHLRLVWDVRDDSPMKNAVEAWQLAFKAGDAVDFMYRAPGEKLDSPGIRKGDLRLLVTMIQGKPKAVLYRPVSEVKKQFLFDAFEGANRPNAVRMDEVRLVDEVVTSITLQEAGYRVEAAIPWELLGGRPAAGAEFRTDVGVLFGDASGSKTMVRAYWQNKNANIVADIPSEAKLQPADWGKATLK